MITKSDLAESVVELAQLDYHIRSGPRKKTIERKLREEGFEPAFDKDGNLCYMKGEGEPRTMFTSHYDNYVSDVSKFHAEIIEYEGATGIRGYLDNAVGVAENMELIKRVKPRGTRCNIFTNEEENYRGCSPKYGIEKVCDELEFMGFIPDLAIALDVDTYKNSHTNNAVVYAENFSSKILAKMMEEFFSEKNFHSIKVINEKSKDEAIPLGERYAAFSLCPAIEGEMHGLNIVNVNSLKASTQALEAILNSPEFIKKAANEDKKARK